MRNQLPTLSLSIHFPWCIQKCPYCDFNSHTVKQGIPEQEYINALLTDLENDLPLVWGRKVNTIFMGGGTPSLFSAQATDQLLSGIRARIPLSSQAEITLEANPGSVENSKLKDFFDVGINRLSLGVQSFHDEQLQLLGRIHDAETAISAVQMAKQAGFENINIDIMFALPNQTLAQAIADVETAISLKPTHISYYQLTIEPNTEFHHHPPSLPNDDLAWEIYMAGRNKLVENKFSQYEVSAYALEKQHSRHNMNYWLFGDYLGIGAGANAKISNANEQTITRYWKHRHPKDYLSMKNNSAITGQNTLQQQEILFEFLMNGLRLTNGFELTTFEQHTGVEKNQLLQMLDQHITNQLVIWDESNNRIKTSDQGQLFLNSILENLLPAD